MERPLNLMVPLAQTPQEPEETKPDEPVVVEVNENPNPSRPNELRLHLWDGNVITGELEISELTLTTEFGALTIPVSKIVSLRPGLDSFPDRQAEIAKLVDDLGAPDFQQRENARRALLAMGRMLHEEIYRFDDGGNGERKRHLEEIRKEFEQQMDAAEELDEWDGDEQPRPLIRKDQVQTRDFVVVGKLSPEAFQVASKYGPLTVKLADVRYADREPTGSLVRRANVTVQGSDFAGSAMKSTSIRLERGDRVIVRAGGSITMTPWGNQAVSNPDGNTSYGVFESYGGGTLLARIGDSGEYIKIGAKATFTARKAGLLSLGIAVQPDYAQQGYQFPGQYNVKLIVESQQTE